MTRGRRKENIASGVTVAPGTSQEGGKTRSLFWGWMRLLRAALQGEMAILLRKRAPKGYDNGTTREPHRTSRREGRRVRMRE